MTIRSRLLSLLLPTLILSLTLISLFFFFNWNNEIRASFRANLKSIVVTAAELLNAEEIAWIKAHQKDPKLQENPVYKRNLDLFQSLKKKLPVVNLFVVSIEPVELGEKVLLDEPLSDTNKVNDGTNPELGDRQVYLVDSNADMIYQDYSESNEHLIYYNKTPLVTPIYRSKGSDQEYMSGYAPIQNDKGEVVALVGADVNLDLLNRIVNHALWVMLLSFLVIVGLITMALIFIANKITQPVSQLKNAALALAAGEYEEKVSVGGPKEIAELAHTFNTMRECLLDHINKLRESSFLREKLYGENECAVLLQNRMLDGSIDHFDDPRVLIKHITSALPSPAQGLKLLILPSPDSIHITLSESVEEGFEGVYTLLSGSEQTGGELSTSINFAQGTIAISNNSMPVPLIWSTKSAKLAPDGLSTYNIEAGDFMFFANQELELAFTTRDDYRDSITKVLRQFANEDIETLLTMLTSEVNFLLKKQHTARQVHIFCIKILEE